MNDLDATYLRQYEIGVRAGSAGLRMARRRAWVQGSLATLAAVTGLWVVGALLGRRG